MDSRSVYTVSIDPVDAGVNSYGETQKDLVAFILDFHIDNSYIYRYAPRRKFGYSDVKLTFDQRTVTRECLGEEICL
jgi:hypothetical protein